MNNGLLTRVSTETCTDPSDVMRMPKPDPEKTPMGPQDPAGFFNVADNTWSALLGIVGAGPRFIKKISSKILYKSQFSGYDAPAVALLQLLTMLQKTGAVEQLPSNQQRQPS